MNLKETVIKSHQVIIGLCASFICLSNAWSASAQHPAPKFHGNFSWKAHDAYKSQLKRIGNTIWVDTSRDRHMRWVSAKGHCEMLSVGGIKGFSLPNPNEFEQLFKDLVKRRVDLLKSLSEPEREERITYLLSQRAPTTLYPIFTGTNSDGYWTLNGSVYRLRYNRHNPDIEANRSMTFAESEAKRDGYGAYWLPAQKCVLKSNPSFEQLYDAFYKSSVQSSLHKADASLPSKPKKPNIPELVKGEFEKTADFKKRKSDTNRKYNSEYEKNYQNYLAEIKKRKSEVDKEKSNILSSYNLAKQAYKNAFLVEYGAPSVTNITYDADNEQFSYIIRANKLKTNLKQPVPLSYAKKFKEISSSKDFKPTVLVSVDNNGYRINGIKEFLSPMALVEQNEFDDAFESIEKLEGFISKYPSSTLKSKAEKQKQLLIAKQQDRERRDRKYRQAQIDKNRKAQAATQQAYRQKKYVGDQVCMTGSMAFGFINPTVTGYVEKVSGDKIQIRISDSEGTSPNYNGTTLNKNTLIWDHYQNWKSCN